MKMGTFLGLSALCFTAQFLAIESHAQSPELAGSDLIACASPLQVEGAVKSVKVLIADTDSKFVSLSTQSNHTVIYQRSSSILNIAKTATELTYSLNRNSKDPDFNLATLTIDLIQKAGCYEKTGVEGSSDRYRQCRGFAKGDYTAINIWIKNLLN